MAQLSFLGVPMHEGADQYGTIMGPDALRAAGLMDHLSALGHHISDLGDLIQPVAEDQTFSRNLAVQNLGSVTRWIETIRSRVEAIAPLDVPIFAGGDHALSAGTVSAMAKRAAAQARPLYVLWLDAHPDFHTLETTSTGNLHGTPMAYLTGEPGFEEGFPALEHPVPCEQVMMVGLRSVDAAERARLASRQFNLCDMRRMDEEGIVRPLSDFLARIKEADGMLHVSLDLDFLDPDIAPGVGTPVPGGATLREAHLIMELVHESRLLSSLDLVELNPFHDHAGRSARLLVDLTASLFGRRILNT
ncbi:MAG: arginase [Alphaproteobacteria bacterium]